MDLNKARLDAWITREPYGDRWGEGEEAWVCPGHDLVFIGDEPNDYDYPETGTHPVYVCRNCSEVFDRRLDNED